MRSVIVVLGVAASLALGSVVSAGSLDSAVKIVNESAWDIHQLYLSSVDEEEWGPDQLGEQVIESGDSFELNGIPCDAYDVRIVDEDGDECVVSAVALCGDKDAWVIDDDDLLSCQAETEE